MNDYAHHFFLLYFQDVLPKLYTKERERAKREEWICMLWKHNYHTQENKKPRLVYAIECIVSQERTPDLKERLLFNSGH